MKLRRRHKKQHGTKTTLGLVIILVLILLVIWSEFISGPNRVKEQIYTTLYWYNAKSELITSRDIETLNYKKAKRIAKKNYKIKCESVVLGYGYNNPVYEIRGSNKMILLDYDSFERVYERKIQ